MNKTQRIESLGSRSSPTGRTGRTRQTSRTGPSGGSVKGLVKHGDTPFLPHGGYRKLRSYAVAEAIYDATVVLCRRFYPHDRRMRDQMVQAARSGVRNISESKGASSSKKAASPRISTAAGKRQEGETAQSSLTSQVRLERRSVGHQELLPDQELNSTRRSAQFSLRQVSSIFFRDYQIIR